MSAHLALETASSWVQRFAHLIPDGEVLDLASGSGRHSRFAAQLGHDVLAVDRDADALRRCAGPRITTQQIDLESGSSDAIVAFVPNRFAGIIVSNYLHRPLFEHIAASLAPGGVLIYETFALGNERFGKPSNPHFLLSPGELLKLAASSTSDPLRVVAYEDGYVEMPKPAMVQRICALKAQHAPAAAAIRLI